MHAEYNAVVRIKSDDPRSAFKIYEAQRSKCYPYWPETVHRKLYFSSGYPGTMPNPIDSSSSGTASKDRSHPIAEFEVENVACRMDEHFACSTLRLTHLPSGRRRTVEHFAYFSWPDHGVPLSTTGLQQLLSSVQDTYNQSIRQLGYSSFMDQIVPPPPVVVHCSAGIGRTGTYVTADICTKWLIDSTNTAKLINIPLTVSRVRSQRCGCVQVAAQYVFCYRVLIDYALQHKLLDDGPDSLAQTALDLLKPPLPHHTESSGLASISPIFYHSSSLPRPGHHPPGVSSSVFGSGGPVPSGLSATLAEFRNLLPTTQLLSIWHAMKSKRDQEGGAQALVNTDFVMTENICSDSESTSDADHPVDSFRDSPRAVMLDRVSVASQRDKVDTPRSTGDCSPAHSNRSSVSSHTTDADCPVICVPGPVYLVHDADAECTKSSGALNIEVNTEKAT
ncbi:unnamed protein product [Echinostoma caproni]|uniref:Tyrosine-protein phosphatase domain-containing protein n=1 Tax=Echinostoma caproni TaxID=27848 RepID=A0A3P8HHN7_9TREM|nr:unnamed protein product [Echinostoma caproni]